MDDGQVKVLDHGYAMLVETWGSDERVIEAARMSTAKGFLGWGPDDACLHCNGTGLAFKDVEIWSEAPATVTRADGRIRLVGGRMQIERVEERCEQCDGGGKKPGDEKLLKFLWDKRHATPFEMAGIVIEVKAPLFVFREWHRHRTQSYNEMSARYVPLPDENYVPTFERLMMANRATANRQAQGVGGKLLGDDDALQWLARLEDLYDALEEFYQFGLSVGVPKELARIALPVGRYSAMRACANLRNWLGFLALRCDPAAQWEIRQYANVVAGFVKSSFPRTYEVARESVGMP
jgi:thymidylate synthase (FAD)